VYYLELLASRGALESRFTGSTIKHFTREAFVQLPVPNPPLPEQRRIVARIEELFSRLDAGVAALRHAKAQLQRYRQSVLAAAVTGQLTQAWREQHPDTESAEKLLERVSLHREQLIAEKRIKNVKVTVENSENNEPHPIPATWTWTPLFEIANPQDPNPSHRMPKYVQSGGYPFISTENFADGDSINFSKGKRIAKETLDQQIERFDIDITSFVFSRIGTIGKTRPLPTERNYGISHALCVISPLSDEVSGRFLRLVMSAESSLVYARSETQSIGVPDLGMGSIRTMPIPLPPLAEQHQIVAEVEARTTAIDHLEAELDRQITRSNRLRQSTLASAFSGNLVCNCHDDHRLDYHLQHQKAHA
jgi:type I restriction enzyme S subunit